MKLINLSGYHVQYRVSVIGSIGFLPWVTDLNDYAGIKGKKIDKVQIRIVK
jgi:N-acetylmuramoyl-L-alanine amidase